VREKSRDKRKTRRCVSLTRRKSGYGDSSVLVPRRRVIGREFLREDRLPSSYCRFIDTVKITSGDRHANKSPRSPLPCSNDEFSTALLANTVRGDSTSRFTLYARDVCMHACMYLFAISSYLGHGPLGDRNDRGIISSLPFTKNSTKTKTMLTCAAICDRQMEPAPGEYLFERRLLLSHLGVSTS